MLFLTILCVQKKGGGEGSEVSVEKWPDVGQKCTLKSHVGGWTCDRGESCDLCEAGSHISTRAEQE